MNEPLAIAGSSTPAAPTIEAMRKVRVPVRITHGRDDAVVLPHTVDKLVAEIPHATVSWFEGCGHSPFAEDAPRFNKEALAFIEACQKR